MLLAAAPAAAEQRFCAPQGVFEVKDTALLYHSKDPTARPAKIGRVQTSMPYATLTLTAPDGLGVNFIPDQHGTYSPSTAGWARQWLGWHRC